MSDRNGRERCFRAAALLLALPTFVACSKTVEWDEEVPLNTGETIWVKRHSHYELQGAAGNPLDLKYRPTRSETISFQYGGMKYRYEGDARIMLLAISPGGVPSLLAKAADKRWNYAHKYGCTIPFYVQLVPSADGRNWTWPQQIEPWLYGKEKNLMLSRFDAEQMKSKYTAVERRSLDHFGVAKGPGEGFVDKDYAGDLCGRRG